MAKKIVRKMKTMDGNEAAAHASYAFTEVAAIYPITPSSVMAEHTDEWATEGRKNLFGEVVQVKEMQSEAGAAGAVHGSLAAGALTTTYTASQGLLLMIPNLYKIAGEGLPGVFNVSARAIASHALSIFGDHSDIYACRQTGVCMLASGSVQEVMDLTPVAHLSAIKGKLPFINFFDGFRTSHEIQKVETWADKDLKSLLDMKAVKEFKDNAMNPNHPDQRGSAQNPDIFFQTREACNSNYNNMPKIVEGYMDAINKMIGTNYKLFSYYGDKSANHVIIAMGSVCQTIEEYIDYMNKKKKAKIGVIEVHLYRPFSKEHLLKAMPSTVKTISVLDRTKEPGAFGEPLYLDVVAALRGTKFEKATILGGRYGLGSKNTTPEQIAAVYANKKQNGFTIGIKDDVTKLSLKEDAEFNSTPEGTTCCKFWGLGSDGTVGANKNSIKIIGDNTNMYVQAYFDYDSKKSGGLTTSHLRFGMKPIKSTYLISKANFVACHKSSYLENYNMVEDLVDGGTFLLNCDWNEKELEKNLPDHVKKYIATHKINFYIIDGVKIGVETGMGPTRINTILQSAFFKLTGIIPEKKAIEYMKTAAKATYGRKGEDVVKKNFDAIDAGANGAIKVNVPASWKTIKVKEVQPSKTKGDKEQVKFVDTIQRAVNNKKGDKLPVSAFKDYVYGNTPSGTSQFEKRGIAVKVPTWHKDNCIECNFCSIVCPHAAIRPVALTNDEAKNMPKGMNAKELTGMPNYKFAIVTSALDCTGCGVCADTCPGMRGEKALVMKDLSQAMDEQKYFDYAVKLPEKEDVVEKYAEGTVKGSQFKKPYLEFSGACAGCGETPYAKLVTQLFGDRMYIANATGCSSIWGNSSPSTPYTKDSRGRGPAWNNSLFEDNAEFGYGMFLAQKAIRGSLLNKAEKLMLESTGALKDALKEYIDTYKNSKLNGKATDKLIPLLLKSSNSLAKDMLSKKDYLSKKSQWIFGGDGWGYDIGFGGVDHVLAQNEDVNIMIFDTEVYSNTGGQSSKSTPTAAVAQFAAGGKEVKKKDLASIAMSYGYVYVAQICLGADRNQAVKAIMEAENYDGPSLIIAYSPCINHGIKKGMGKAEVEERLAVECGYWHNFRFRPNAADGENKFTLDSKEPNFDKYKEFLEGEVRYSSLTLKDKDKALRLFEKNEMEAKARFSYLKALGNLYSATANA